MIYKGYVGKVELDEEAKILHGGVVGLRDVVTFQADSAANIESAFKDSVDDYLAFCKQRGEAPERPASGRFLVRLDAGLHRQLTMLAELRGTSLNSLVEKYLSAEVQQHLTEFEKTHDQTTARPARMKRQSSRPKRKSLTIRG
ncbi:MAG: type II toxin-antitoxin system HicB family antitoxin [Phycisphaerae bacterium]|nr:type II toxin-antitoxin system HicB family antitoxin [Phycisphaerae bacterium]